MHLVQVQFTCVNLVYFEYGSSFESYHCQSLSQVATVQNQVRIGLLCFEFWTGYGLDSSSGPLIRITFSGLKRVNNNLASQLSSDPLTRHYVVALKYNISRLRIRALAHQGWRERSTKYDLVAWKEGKWEVGLLKSRSWFLWLIAGNMVMEWKESTFF